MAYQIERPSPCRVVVSATVPAAEVQEEREHILASVAPPCARSPASGPARRRASLVERRYRRRHHRTI